MAIDISKLNAAQQQAVLHTDGPMLVLAGAGTGKTTVITYRVANLLDHGIAPSNIIAVTFTNKAAREMRERLESMLPHVDPRELTVSTFHSFCCRVLRKHAREIGMNNNFGIADEGDSNDVIKSILIDKHMKDGELGIPYFVSAISNAKNFLKKPEDLRNSTRATEQLVGEIYEAYQERLRMLNLVDFDDLLTMTVHLWREHEDVLEKFRARYTHILVDEYQDTNSCQAELMQLLAGSRQNICVVGDDDQSIYGWRGADVSNILGFPEQYRNTEVIRLEENYRSVSPILAAANHVIARNKHRHGKELWSGRKEGDIPYLVEVEDGDKEAQIVTRLIKHYSVERGVPYDEMAILYRSNHLSRGFEMALRKEKIPNRIVGGKAFYERREIKDTAAYLRIISNPANELSLRRVINTPPRGVGAGTLEKLENHSRATRQSMLASLRDEELLDRLPNKTANGLRGFSEAYQGAFEAFSTPGSLGPKMRDYLLAAGYLKGLKKIYRDHREAEERLANVYEFINSAVNFEEQFGPKALLDFLEANSLSDENDRSNKDTKEDAKGVSLMTVHAAKGLEFQVVFIVAVEQRIFPHERSLLDRDISEERRLFYVAMTRAKEHLVLTRARRRIRFGTREPCVPSEFTMGLPPELLAIKTPDQLFTPASAEQVQNYMDELYARLRAD